MSAVADRGVDVPAASTRLEPVQHLVEEDRQMLARRQTRHRLKIGAPRSHDFTIDSELGQLPVDRSDVLSQRGGMAAGRAACVCSGVGRALRSILPLGVSGKDSSITKADGIMNSGRLCFR